MRLAKMVTVGKRHEAEDLHYVGLACKEAPTELYTTSAGRIATVDVGGGET